MVLVFTQFTAITPISSIYYPCGQKAENNRIFFFKLFLRKVNDKFGKNRNLIVNSYFILDLATLQPNESKHFKF